MCNFWCLGQLSSFMPKIRQVSKCVILGPFRGHLVHVYRIFSLQTDFIETCKNLFSALKAEIIQGDGFSKSDNVTVSKISIK